MHYEFPPALAALGELNEREQATDALLKPGSDIDDRPPWAHAMLKNQRVLLRSMAAIIGPPLRAAVEQHERRVKPALIVPPNGAKH